MSVENELQVPEQTGSTASPADDMGEGLRPDTIEKAAAVLGVALDDTRTRLLSPGTVAETASRLGVDLRGWHVESIEGAPSPYEFDREPDAAVEFAERLKDRFFAASS
jgi:hypothetical protein